MVTVCNVESSWPLPCPRLPACRNLDTFACIHRVEFDSPVLALSLRPDRSLDLLATAAAASASSPASSPPSSSARLPSARGSSGEPRAGEGRHKVSSQASDTNAHSPPHGGDGVSVSPTRESEGASARRTLGVDEWKGATTATLCVVLGSRVIKVRVCARHD